MYKYTILQVYKCLFLYINTFHINIENLYNVMKFKKTVKILNINNQCGNTKPIILLLVNKRYIRLIHFINM